MNPAFCPVKDRRVSGCKESSDGTLGHSPLYESFTAFPSSEGEDSRTEKQLPGSVTNALDQDK